MLDYEYICDRIAKFHKKILFITRVINIQILTTKYFSFQYSVYCSQALRRPAHRARATVHLLTHETPDFITPALWPANSLDLNPVDNTRFGGSCRSACTAARFVTSTSWSRAWSKSWIGNISTRWSSIKRSGSGVHIFEIAFVFEHTVDILNTDFRCAEVLPFVRTHTWQSITLMPIVDTYAFEWPYSNLVEKSVTYFLNGPGCTKRCIWSVRLSTTLFRASNFLEIWKPQKLPI